MTLVHSVLIFSLVELAEAGTLNTIASLTPEWIHCSNWIKPYQIMTPRFSILDVCHLVFGVDFPKPYSPVW